MILLKRHDGRSEILDREENADIFFLPADGNILQVGIRCGKLPVAGMRMPDFEVLTGNAFLIGEKNDRLPGQTGELKR